MALRPASSWHDTKRRRSPLSRTSRQFDDVVPGRQGCERKLRRVPSRSVRIVAHAPRSPARRAAARAIEQPRRAASELAVGISTRTCSFRRKRRLAVGTSRFPGPRRMKIAPAESGAAGHGEAHRSLDGIEPARRARRRAARSRPRQRLRRGQRRAERARASGDADAAAPHGCLGRRGQRERDVEPSFHASPRVATPPSSPTTHIAADAVSPGFHPAATCRRRGTSRA